MAAFEHLDVSLLAAVGTLVVLGAGVYQVARSVGGVFDAGGAIPLAGAAVAVSLLAALVLWGRSGE